LTESNEEIKYLEIDEATEEGNEYLGAIREETTEKLGYFLRGCLKNFGILFFAVVRVLTNDSFSKA